MGSSSGTSRRRSPSWLPGGHSESWWPCGISAGSRERVSFGPGRYIRLVMQVENIIAFDVDQAPAGLEILINFGVFAGRDATTAELEELGKLLVPEAGAVSIISEDGHHTKWGGHGVGAT